jgi:hypothetical protein
VTPVLYTEDTLVQQPTAEYLERKLGWDSVYAYNNEDFGPDSLLGRSSGREVVLTRYFRAEGARAPLRDQKNAPASNKTVQGKNKEI